MKSLHLPRRVAHLLSVALVASAVTTGAVGPPARRTPKVTAAVVELGRESRSTGWRHQLTPPGPTEMVGFQWRGGAGAVAVRARSGAGWSDWVEVHGNPDEGPDPASPEHRTLQSAGPVWVGRDVEELDIEVREGSLRDLRLHAIHSPSPERSSFGPDGAAALPSQPGIISRAGWGADESWRTYASGCDGGVSYASRVRNAFVHHTDSVNSYSGDEAAALVRGIYYFHTHTNGWCDIGYNFLVDRFGRVYEGRYGGVTKAVIGAHTGGFNTGATGVSLIGSHGTTSVSTEARGAVRDLLAWKMGLHGADPRTTVTVTSGGSSRYPAGTVVTLNAISGHRDASQTACPGDLAYGLLPQLRIDVQRGQLATPAFPLPGWTAQKDVPGLLALHAFGGLIPGGSRPAVDHQAYWNGFPIARAAILEATGGLVLDGYGGLHPFGGAPGRTPSGYWRGWDIARDIVGGPVPGTGWVLDGYGGMHPFGGAPPSIGGPYFGFDIARAAVTTPDRTGGYVLDGYGGVHRFGAAPALAATGYWRGWDIARGLALRSDGKSGWVLDGWGGLHPFGGAPAVAAPKWTQGADRFRGIAANPDGDGGWVLDVDGFVYPFGGAPPAPTFLTYTGAGIGRDLLASPAPAATP